MSRMTEVYRVPKRSPWATSSIMLSSLIGILTMMSGFGSRLGFWNFRTGFVILRWCFVGGIATGLVSLWSCWDTLPFRTERRGFTISILALLISGLVVGLPVRWKLRADSAPAIHDITTDLQNPPKFRILKNNRSSDQNAIEYAGEDVAVRQRDTYPDLDTIILSDSRGECMRGLLRTVRKLDWTIHAANWETGRIEAVDTTFWFGFKDDVVLRLKNPTSERCSIDVRSTSRVGVGDAGTNANRIRYFKEKFLETMKIQE